jgi:hypothetical protein
VFYITCGRKQIDQLRIGTAAQRSEKLPQPVRLATEERSEIPIGALAHWHDSLNGQLHSHRRRVRFALQRGDFMAACNNDSNGIFHHNPDIGDFNKQ